MSKEDRIHELIEAITKLEDEIVSEEADTSNGDPYDRKEFKEKIYRQYKLCNELKELRGEDGKGENKRGFFKSLFRQ